ncbi:hypothetical protein [Solibacillus sp.]|uniref:hypothetical protein n=1 Tax=Solibacillus sp. TaxID=1909654 RepID=UPI003314FD38
MTQLLRLHFRFSSKAILFFLLFIIGIAIIYSSEIIHLNLVTFLFIAIMYLPTICLAHLLNGKFSILLRTFPISFKQFVQSAYIYMIMLFSIFLVPIIFWLLYQLLRENIDSFTLCYILWIVAFTVVTTGGILKAYFKEPTNSKAFSGPDVFFCITLTEIPHTLLCIFFSFSSFIFVGALITPAVCLFIFYRQYKASVELYKKAEFL